MTENFLNVDPEDNRFKNAKVILITADCSKSGITNPIDFIVNEGEGVYRDRPVIIQLFTGNKIKTRL